MVNSKSIGLENKNKMESKIAEWKNALYPSNWWIYLVIAVVVLAGAAFFFIKRKKVIGEKSK